MNTLNTAIPSWLQSTSTSSSQIRQLNTKEIEELAEYVKATSYEIPNIKNRRFEDFMSEIMWNKKLPENGFYTPPGTISRVGETAKQTSAGSVYAILNDKEIWNNKANENTIKTAFGEMRISLKLDGFYYDLDSLKELSFLDTFNDGFITKEDFFADKLILRGYDEDGNEIELNFFDVVGQFDLTELYNDKKIMLNSGQRALDASNAWRAQQNGFSPLSAAYQNLQLSVYGNSSYRAEVSYQKHDTKNTIAFFESYADKNGWIDFKNDAVARRIFDSQSLQLAYRKVGADGASRLEKISFATNYNKNLDIFNSEVPDDKTGINVKMQKYMAGMRVGNPDFDRRAIFSAVVNQEPISGYSYWIGPSPILNAQAFSDVTGLAYTEANVQRVKEGLANGGEEFLNSLADIEAVTAMHLDKDAGRITLRFSSGRETTIAIEDLYSDSGEFVVDENGERALQMSGAAEMSEEELNNLDFDKVGAIFDDSNKVASLKSWGITAIQKATYGDGRFLSFVLTNAEGMKFNVRELYNLSYLSGGWLEGDSKQTETSTDSALQKAAPKPIVSPNKPIDMRV
ncbi:MAG: hypothetical protein K2N12_06035 [Helicobacter sp.]|nr:hypothetical protein [Helicobacter sp.]